MLIEQKNASRSHWVTLVMVSYHWVLVQGVLSCCKFLLFCLIVIIIALITISSVKSFGVNCMSHLHDFPPTLRF